MALNFPPQNIGGSLPAIGSEWYDNASDTTWEVIDHVSDGTSTIAVWQIKSAGTGSLFGGVVDITAAPPNPLPTAGTYYVVQDPGGTVNAGFGNLAGQTFVGGEQIIYTGDATDPWISIGGSLPEATTSQQGIVQLATTADIAANNNDKAVTPDMLNGDSSSGTLGYWTRTGTNLSPVNIGDNVGIGTASPASLLHAKGATGTSPYFYLDAGSTAAIFGVNDGATKEVYLGSVTNTPVLFRQSNTERMRIDSSGRIGIGTSNVNSTVDIHAASPEIRITATGANRAVISHSAAGLDITQFGAANLLFGTNATERMRIDSSGKVKIGGSDQFALDISYDNSGATAAKIVTNTGVTNASSTLTFAVNENSGAQLQLKGDGAAVFSEGSTERMRIDSSGNVGIGTTSPTGLLTVAASAPAIDWTFAANTAFKHSIESTGYASEASGNSLAIKVASGSGTQATVMHLNGAGNVGIGTTTPGEKLEVNGTIKATDINFTGLATYADDTAAGTGGLVAGDVYKTSTGELRIKL